MISTAFIRDCIVDKEKTHLIHGAIAAGHVAVRDADLRSVHLRPVPAWDSCRMTRRCAGPRNVDEFKLRVQGISTTADLSRDQMASTLLGGKAPEITGSDAKELRRLWALGWAQAEARSPKPAACQRRSCSATGVAHDLLRRRSEDAGASRALEAQVRQRHADGADTPTR